MSLKSEGYDPNGGKFRVFQTAAPLYVVLAFCFALAPFARAQKDTATIVGTVKDASGAVIPDAKVTVTDVDRGNTFAATTNPSGDYVASPLRIGHYTVKVEKEGFKTAVAGPIELQLQDRAEVNVTLEVGQTVQTVEVKGAVPLLETQTSELGQVVNTRLMGGSSVTFNKTNGV